MKISTLGLVLKEVPYGDQSSIVHIFTRDLGLRSFMVKGLRRPGAKTKRAFFMPLTLLEFSCDSQYRNLTYLSDVKLHIPYRQIYSDVYKSSVAVFLSDVLDHILAEKAEDARLFDTIQQRLLSFDEASVKKAVDFHWIFMSELALYLGFEPMERTGSSCPYFDLREGIYTATMPFYNDYLDKASTEIWYRYNGYRWDDFLTSGEFLRAEERNCLLDAWVKYYQIHLGMGEIKSLAVLREVYSLLS